MPGGSVWTWRRRRLYGQETNERDKRSTYKSSATLGKYPTLHCRWCRQVICRKWQRILLFRRRITIIHLLNQSLTNSFHPYLLILCGVRQQKLRESFDGYYITIGGEYYEGFGEGITYLFQCFFQIHVSLRVYLLPPYLFSLFLSPMYNGPLCTCWKLSFEYP